MVAGLLLAAVLWSGMVPGLSPLVLEAESSWADRVATWVHPAPTREDIVFLGIDEASLSLTEVDEQVWRESEVLQLFRGRWPWNRRVWAAVIERLAEAGASQIVLDLTLKNPSDDPAAEEALVEAIAKYRKQVVLAADVEPLPPSEQGGARTIFAEPNEEYLGPLEDETAFGFVNFWPDPDGVIRETVYRMSLREMNDLERHPDEHVFESLSAVMGRRMGALPPEGPQRLRYAVRGRKVDGVKRREIAPVYAPISLYKIFFEETWEAEFENGEFFRDKVVLIGPAAPVFQDSHTTPAGMIYGGQLHLQSLGCLVAGAFLHEAPAYWNWAGLIGMALVGALLVLWIRNPVLVIVLAVVVVGIWLLGVILIADRTSMLSGGIPGALGLVAVVLFGQSFEFLLERRERSRLFSQLSRSVSRDVAQAMVRSPDGYIDSARGGRRRMVVLFSDIRSFTERSEREDPEALVTQLNEYLSCMVDLIFKYGGTLDKFIGDAIMATWGGLEDTRSTVMAREALRAAGEMQEELARLNAKWEEEGREGFESGIGIHIGDAVIGEVGSRQRSDFTAIGDAVNLASRIEGLTKVLGVPVLVSGEIASLQADRNGLCSLGKFRVKGRSEPVEIAAAFVKREEAFLEGLLRFGDGDFVSAEGVLLEVPNESELAGPAKFYLRQMEVWKRVPRKEWDGVVTLDTK